MAVVIIFGVIFALYGFFLLHDAIENRKIGRTYWLAQCPKAAGCIHTVCKDAVCIPKHGCARSVRLSRPIANDTHCRTCGQRVWKGIKRKPRKSFRRYKYDTYGVSDQKRRHLAGGNHGSISYYTGN